MRRLLNAARNLPIRHKITLAFVGTSLAVLVLNAAVYLYLGWNAGRHRIEEELHTTALVFAENISAALSFHDQGAAQTLLSSVKAMTQIELVCVYAIEPALGSAETLFTSYHGAASAPPCPARRNEIAAYGNNFIEVTQDITLGEEVLGHIYFRRGTHDLADSTRITGLMVLLMLLVSTLVAYSLTAFFRRLIEFPIERLLNVTRAVSRSNDFGVRAEKTSEDEIGQLFDSFNLMLLQIQARDAQLQDAHRELKLKVQETERSNVALNESLEQLKNTQQQLVQQEKMASLGNLVAGVAHEINTPIGVGVTAASTLLGNSEDVIARYEQKRLTNSGLQAYLSSAVQSSTILLKNLERAANLIQSFKQVAVDQASSEVRRFALGEYLDEILLSLRPNLKKTPISILLNVDQQIEVVSYPGAISQIVTNLVMNSLVHAFPDGAAGEISIAGSVSEGDRILLVYKDNGAGMTPHVLQRVFDPFFTTRRGAGGSGLGMHIVYNLVTQQLHGNITIESQPGHGVELKINFPRNLAHEEPMS